MGVCPCPLMPQRPQSPLAPARRTGPQHPPEPGAQDGAKERKISEHVGNINNYTIWILCVGRTWMTGTPRSFRSWRQSLVWDDAACSTREDIHCMSRICLKTNEICVLGCYWCFLCVWPVPEQFGAPQPAASARFLSCRKNRSFNQDQSGPSNLLSVVWF